MAEGPLVKAILEFVESDNKKKRGQMFSVQFNPVQLQYTVSSGQCREEKTQKAVNFQSGSGKRERARKAAYESPQTVEVELTFPLVFDRSLEPEEGVAKEVEGLAAAVLDPCKRKVVFRWGSLRFEGILRVISGDYCMFGSQGKPLRAKMSVSICSSGRHSIPKSWTDSTRKIFGV